MSMKDTLSNLKTNVVESKKILMCAGAIIVGCGLYAATRHTTTDVHKANIGNSPSIHSHLTGNESENYQKEVKRADLNRAEEAKKNNENFMVTLPPNVVPKNDNSLNKLLNDKDEQGSSQDAPPELPDAMPHIQTSQAEAQPQGSIVKKKPKKPKIMVDEKRIGQLEKWMATDIAQMDNFKPGVIYANKEVLSSKTEVAQNTANNNLTAGTDSSLSNSSIVADSSPTFDLPAIGTMLEAHFASEVDSRTPGIVIGVVDSGPYAGARILGAFQTSQESHKLMVSFKQMTVTWTDDNGDLRSKTLDINAFAVDPNNLSQGMATYVNRHVMAKIGFQMATSFMQGLGQAIQQSGSSAMMTASGGTVISQGSRNLQQEMLQAGGTSAGRIGNTLQSLYGNVPDTIKIAQNTPFALLFVGKN